MEHTAQWDFFRAWVLGAALLLAVDAAAELVDAGVQERSIERSTKHLSLVVEAGDRLTFDLEVDNRNGASQDMELSMEDIFEGWTGSFSAGRKQVNVVHVKTERSIRIWILLLIFLGRLKRANIRSFRRFRAAMIPMR